MTTQNLILPPGWNKQTIESVTGPGARFEKPAGKIQTPPCWVLSDLELAELLCKAYNQGTGVTTLQSATSSAEREAFEAWLTDFDRGPDLTIDQEGFYDDHGVQRPWSAWQACARLKTASEVDAEDAARYRWLRDQQPNSLSLCRNEGNAPNYMTVAQWVEDCMPKNYTEVHADELQRMKDADTDWALQIYPRSPVSFEIWHAASLDAVIDAARAGEGEVR